MKRSSLTLVFLVGIIVISCVNNSSKNGKYILAKSLAYHDPKGQWPEFKGQLKFEENHIIDDSTVTRKTTVWLDNKTGEFRINRGDTEIHGVENDSCFIIKGNVDCERVFKLRNYYTYLWGLPMKLADEGTNIKENYKDTTFSDIPVYKITAEYDTDTWDYFITKENYRLIGYQFVKKDGSGEVIYLEDEIKVEGMKIPQIRRWYTLDKKFLGEDILLSPEK
ncbi:DUF6503 family protein [Mangrovivirga sp. M17]|uniref:DUF6503 family protein n=1 Tax=Mangrovivirga halotolerans TaxID=2993936 RepID=A0ABT3RPK9_9BACT|nr:DUF6503 family protein [Mangrovivirga halotolerans]MCX2743278.1 DUF6503 family protein [Mangrovivirga halotolerans]